MNSFAMIFGHCVWIPPSPMAALVALNLFFGIGAQTDADYAAAEAVIVKQYVSAGRTELAAKKAVADLDACFGTYEVPPEDRNHPESADATRVRLTPATRRPEHHGQPGRGGGNSEDPQ